jgi:hypothetical protein
MTQETKREYIQESLTEAGIAIEVARGLGEDTESREVRLLLFASVNLTVWMMMNTVRPNDPQDPLLERMALTAAAAVLGRDYEGDDAPPSLL